MASYTNDSVKQLTESYLAGHEYVAQIEVEIPVENKVDPLLLIKIVNGPKEVESIIPLAIELTKGQIVIFKREGKILFQAAVRPDVTPAQFSALFSTQPMLLELLMNVCYGIMLKKLTPPSSALTLSEPTLVAQGETGAATPGF